MAATRARLRTAYEIGRSGDPADRYNFNSDELAEYDRGLAEHDDALEAASRPKARAARPRAGKPASPKTTRRPERSPGPEAGPAGASPAPDPAPSREPQAAPSGGEGGGFTATVTDMGEGAGFLLGLIAAAAVVNAVRGRFGDWVKAKLFNQVRGQ